MHVPTQRRILSLVLLVVLAGLVGTSVAAEESSFTVVLLPDTQFYSERYPQTYLVQTRWIKQQAEAENIKFVIHLGDIVQDPGDRKQWENADRAHRVLDGAVAYSVLPGNHDIDDSSGQRDTPLYNEFFPPSRFSSSAFYGGHLGKRNDANYCHFEAAGMKFLVLSLEFGPTAATFEWAERVLASHRDRRVILATHCYLRPSGRDASWGEKIFNRLVRKHPNVFMVVSGHVLGVHHQQSLNDAGGTVHEILCDYQGRPNGGDGWLQSLRFVPEENKIHVRAYSPLLKKADDKPKHSYTLDYEMGRAVLKKAS